MAGERQLGLWGSVHYPAAAGFKVDGTSQEAAGTIDAATLRGAVVKWLSANDGHTADEIAAGLGMSILSIRPRLSELRALGTVHDTGRRGVNISGRKAIVWGLVSDKATEVCGMSKR